MSLSTRVAELGPSPTLAMTARARTLQAEGRDVISLAAGEPDADTPHSICEAAIDAIRRGFTKYTPTAGIPELRAAIADKLGAENGIFVSPDQVVVTCGAKQALYGALMAVLNPGDEAILLAPFWMTYAEQVRLAGASPVLVPCLPSDGYVPRVEAIEAAIGPRTRALVMNSPCNPTGAVYPRAVIEALAGLAVRHNFWIVSDEIYEKLVYEGEHVSPGSIGDEAAERTVTVNGCSKTYAMTGWRVGYLAAPKPLAQAVCNLQDQVTSHATSFAQKGAVEAFRIPESDIDIVRESFRARRDLIVDGLARIEGIEVHTPKGAFYAFADVRDLLGGRFETDADLALYLLETAGVATIPGSTFYGPGHIRLSYAASVQNIERGVERIAHALSAIRA
jgi:aspartate aminotransferase